VAVKLVQDGAKQLVAVACQGSLELFEARDHPLRRCGGSRRPQIGDEVGDGDVDFMTDRGDDRDLRGRYGPGDNFLIERPQVLDTAPSASDDHQFPMKLRLQGVGGLNGRGNLSPRLHALNPHREHGDRQRIRAALEDLHDVTKGGAGR